MLISRASKILTCDDTRLLSSCHTFFFHTCNVQMIHRWMWDVNVMWWGWGWHNYVQGSGHRPPPPTPHFWDHFLWHWCHWWPLLTWTKIVMKFWRLKDWICWNFRLQEKQVGRWRVDIEQMSMPMRHTCHASHSWWFFEFALNALVDISWHEF